MSRPLSSAAFAALVSLVAVGCTDNPTSPTVSAPYSQTDLRAGTGTEASAGGLLTVNYTGWLFDLTKTDQKGLVFDTSLGKTPFSFTLGAGQVIRGWEVGVNGMRVGGIRRLVIPPSMAYGDQRAGPIPPNTTLVFEIELLSATY
jgi:FKBP-type peptidyl-prolyl cis-trans isomerase FkpA